MGQPSNLFEAHLTALNVPTLARADTKVLTDTNV
jgi:hypothetical protein